MIEPDQPQHVRAERIARGILVVAVVLLIVVLAGTFIKLPYAVERPGPVTDTLGSLEDGSDIEARSGLALAAFEMAEAAGLDPEFSCREGICNTCMCGIREGSVEYLQAPLDPPPAGKVLICCTRPVGRVVLDL